jgi:putative membrane protein
VRHLARKNRISDLELLLHLKIVAATGAIAAFDFGEHPMKKAVMVAAASLLLGAAAFAQAPGTGSLKTQEFVTKVAISDMFEIQSSQLALEKKADADTQPFAQKMVTDHQKTSKELKALIDGGKVEATLPTALDAEHQKMLTDLKAKNGRDFDVAYDQIQQKAHQEAVALFDAYSKQGDNPDLKSWAAKTLPDLKEHLSMAQKLK